VFDILAYLVERFFDFGDYPDLESLPPQLAAAGFEPDDIEDALKWLAALQERAGSTATLHAQATPSVRQFAGTEQQKIDVGGRGYLHFLEVAGILDATRRELVIDRIMAMPDSEVSVDQIKLIALMVLWNHGRPLDALVVEELLASGRSALLH
jgi:Smg protein